MKELGHYIVKQPDGIKKIKIRASINNEIDEQHMLCSFGYGICTENCTLLKFEQPSEAYASNEFDVTFGCIDSLYCSMILEE